MNEGDLETFVTRSRRTLQGSPSMGPKTTELRVVIPFLQLLGWDVHGRAVVPDYAVEDESTVDYALCVDRIPEVFVVTAAAAEDLDPEVGRRLTDAMTAADVDWGIATNGRSFAFLTTEGDERKRTGCELAQLPEETAVLAHYAREAAVQRRDERARSVRTDVADVMTEQRSALVAAVHDAVVVEGGVADPITGELRAASEAFVDRLIETLAAGERPTSLEDDPDPPDAGGPEADTGADSGEDGGTGDADADGPDRRDEGGIVSRDDDGDGTEYVVRFFNGRSSVGAVGHSTSGGAVAQAIEYMIEQHALDSRLNLPWGDGDGRALLNHDPVHPDGTEMAGAKQLSNGYYVDTGVDEDAGRAAVEELADQSGLRVMFRGGWE